MRDPLSVVKSVNEKDTRRSIKMIAMPLLMVAVAHIHPLAPRLHLAPLAAASTSRRLTPHELNSAKAAAPLQLLSMKAPSSRVPDALILGKRTWQVGLSGIVCAALYRALAIIRPPRLFALHVALMAPMLPLGAAAVITVRQRLAPPEQKLSGAERKRRSEWLVIRHFLASATALYAATGGLVAIYLQKQSRGAAHLTTVHSWLGMGTLVLWLGAYLAAQPNVWRDQWRARKFSLLTNKRWLWASITHRRFGTVAYAVSLLAYATGALGWKALHPRLSFAIAAAVVAIGSTTLGAHGAKEAGRMGQALFSFLIGPIQALGWRLRGPRR